MAYSTMVAGEGKNLGEKPLLKLADHFGIKRPDLILEQVREALTNWRLIAQTCGVSKNVVSEIEKTFNRLNKSI